MTEWGSGVLKEVDPQVYGQLTSDIGAKAFQERKEILFNKCCWNT